MSEFKLISPMLDNFAMGDSISEHNGVYCCPAMENGSDNKYIVKIVSTPASQSQLDALLLSGAYPDHEAAAAYFQSITDGIAEEAQILEKLAQLEGYLSFEKWQIVPKEDCVGYDLYLLSQYRPSLQKHFKRASMTHLGALNLGLDLCAALAVCRRLGYLYVNLKPENVFLTGDNEFRIGDLGFIKLDSLKYASLPDRYRSVYTTPEITDAFSALNTTMDIYALGLILYQAFNGGALPEVADESDGQQFAPPAYADYEMSEIILKACAQNPEDRWQDPIQMGQALISYMQRNGAHDTPIIPEVVSSDDGNEDDVGVFEETNAEAESLSDTTQETEPQDLEDDIEVSEEDIYTEDEDGNLTFITNTVDDETVPDDADISEDYEQISEEVNEILNQADELIAHPAPEPVVSPEPIEVTLPDVVPEDENPELSVEPDIGEETPEDEIEDCSKSDSEDTEDTETDNEETSENNDCDNVNEIGVEAEEISADEEDIPAAKRNSAGIWVRNTLLILLALAVIAVGVLFYANYYLQPIESIYLDEVTNGTLTVNVNSQIDESKLTVLCLDMYGNPLTAPVVNGKAVFTGLAPDSAYTIKININGFHRLTGDTSASFTTPEETNIVQFNAVTGAENGSVILGFTVEGPDANEWKVRYSTQDEEEKTATFSGHMVTINGLTVGSEYTFKLEPDTDLLLAGTDTIKHTASNIIKAEHLVITGCIDGKLTANWKAPENTNVENWTVRCYNDKGYDKTLVVTDTTITFEDVDPSVDNTLEVTAAAMSVSERAFAPANAITLTQFSIDSSDANQLKLSWEAAAEKNWKLIYTVNGTATQEIACENEKTASVRDVIPGAEYKFTLQATDGTAVLGGEMVYQTKEAESFSAYGVTADEMQFKMCKTPAHKNWDHYDIKSSDYATEFKVGKKASFLVKLSHKPERSADSVVTLYVIRNTDGTIISTGSNTRTWNSMWDKWYSRYAQFDIPVLPGAAGEYTVTVYINGALAHTQDFTIVS